MPPTSGFATLKAFMLSILDSLKPMISFEINAILLEISGQTYLIKLSVPKWASRTQAPVHVDTKGYDSTAMFPACSFFKVMQYITQGRSK